MVCDKDFMGPEPLMCCSGSIESGCGCMGMPIDPVCCSNECFDLVHQHGLRKAIEIHKQSILSLKDKV